MLSSKGFYIYKYFKLCKELLHRSCAHVSDGQQETGDGYLLLSSVLSLSIQCQILTSGADDTSRQFAQVAHLANKQ